MFCWFQRVTDRDRLHVCGLGCNARSGCVKKCPSGDCVKVAMNVGLGLHFCTVCLLAAADQGFHIVRNFRAYVCLAPRDISTFRRWIKLRYFNFHLLPVNIATDDCGVRFQAGARNVFNSARPILLSVPFALMSDGYPGIFPRSHSCRSVKLAAHLHVVPRLIMRVRRVAYVWTGSALWLV
jgi:hypothetical protein